MTTSLTPGASFEVWPLWRAWWSTDTIGPWLSMPSLHYRRDRTGD